MNWLCPPSSWHASPSGLISPLRLTFTTRSHPWNCWGPYFATSSLSFQRIWEGFLWPFKLRSVLGRSQTRVTCPWWNFWAKVRLPTCFSSLKAPWSSFASWIAACHLIRLTAFYQTPQPLQPWPRPESTAKWVSFLMSSRAWGSWTSHFCVSLACYRSYRSFQSCQLIF